MFTTPILLITFNRPDHVRRVLSEIRKQQPTELYIAQDGPRKDNESDATKVQEVRNVINELVDWHCNLHTLYQEKNLGCGPGPYTAISWFFNKVEMGIILEDDCIPHPDFYRYCEELLYRYKDDNRIALIGGSNYGEIHSNASYSFCSGHMTTWGWASWKRVWKLYDYELKTIDEKLFSNLLHQYHFTWKQREYWWFIWKMVKADQMNGSCWDYQFIWSYWKYGMVAICPSVNLITNVGIGTDATHTMNAEVCISRPIGDILPLVHPNQVLLNKEYDEHLMRMWVNSYDYGWSGIKRLPYLMNRWLKRMVGHEGSWFN